MKDNFSTFKAKYKYQENKSSIKIKEIEKFKQKQKSQKIPKTIMEAFPPGTNIGSMS